jgi:hypothetical protein
MFWVFNVSFDPGVTTGYCVWLDGKIAELPGRKNPGHLAGKGDTFLDRFMSVRSQVSTLLASLHEEGVVGQVAIEEFMGFSQKIGDKDGHGPSFGKITMIKCATVRGGILSVSLSYTRKVCLINKRQVRKIQTAQLAQAYGITTKDKDALDAFQIGVCAGFDRGSGTRLCF